jgi:hypothetical protein
MLDASDFTLPKGWMLDGVKDAVFYSCVAGWVGGRVGAEDGASEALGDDGVWEAEDFGEGGGRVVQAV